MKKSVSKLVTALLLALAICVTGVIGNEASVDAKTKVKISNTRITLTVGQSKTLKVKGTKKKPKWSSSKKSVATVSKKGKVVAKKAGNATITAKIGKKKYKCKVTVKNKVIKYGKVAGNVTYFYNYYRGNVPDTGAVVYLLPKNGKGKKVPDTSYVIWEFAPNTSNLDFLNNQVYIANVDGKGDYHFNRVQTGEYLMVIFSKNTTDEEWYKNKTAYYNTLTSIVSPYLSQNNAKSFGEATSYHKYYTEDITVYENDTTNSSCDFGISYN